jgi:transposase
MEDQKKRYVGIDLAKRTMVVRFLSPNGKVKLNWDGKTDLSGRKKFMSHLKEGDCVYMEACELAFKLAREIMAQTKAKVYILNPRKLHIIWKSTKKTDAIDALKLARFGLRYPVEELPLVPLPTEEEEKLRSAVHELNFLKKQRTRYINRLHAIFTGAGITTLTKKDLKTMEARKRSLLLLTERRLAQASRIYHQLKMLEEQIEEVEHEQATLLVKNDTAKHIMSIPGVGPGFAAVYTAFIGNGERFSNVKQVSNYSGLVPTVDQSGDKTYYGGINKASNSAIRGVAVLAAWALIRSKHGGTLKEKYEKKARERGKFVAVVMLARKIVELCYILVKNKTYYDNGELVPENPKLKKLQMKVAKKEEKVA